MTSDLFRIRSARFLALSALACVAALTSVAAQPIDLSGLPEYKPGPSLQGVIRIHGTELSEHVIHLWEDGFLRHNPLVRYVDCTYVVWMSGLCAGTADLGVMGHDCWRSDLKAFEGIFGYDPTEIMYATGGFDQRKGNTPGTILFVNRENPLSRLTMRQVDGIFGAQRSGGWQGTHWSTANARTARDNIRTWGQLGLTGEWADRPIHPYGLDATLSNWSEQIQKVAFKGGDKWNPAIKEIVRGGVEVPADAVIVSSVAGDRDGIGFNFMRLVEANPGVKALALAAGEGGPYVDPTARSFFDRTYPLVNMVSIALNKVPGKPLEPRIREFMRYVLSRNGQQDVVTDGMFIPLNPEAASEQWKKIE